MSGKYQSSMEQVHAPRELIERTKQDVSREQAESRKVVAFPHWKPVAAVAAALMLVVCAVLFWNAGQTPVFTVLPSAEAEVPGGQFGQIDPQKRKVSMEEFDQAFGTALGELEAENGPVEEFSAWLTRSPEGEAQTGAATFRCGGCTVRLGKGEPVLPAALTATKAQKLAGVQVYLARQEETELLLAGFSQDGMDWLVSAEELDRQEFLNVVTALAGNREGEK